MYMYDFVQFIDLKKKKITPTFIIQFVWEVTVMSRYMVC